MVIYVTIMRFAHRRKIQTGDNLFMVLGAACERVIDAMCFARSNLYLLKRRPPALPKKCLDTFVSPFDDGRPEYEELFTLVQG